MKSTELNDRRDFVRELVETERRRYFRTAAILAVVAFWAVLAFQVTGSW